MVNLVSHEARQDLNRLVQDGAIQMDGDSHIIPLKDPYMKLLQVAEGERIPYYAIYSAWLRDFPKRLLMENRGL